MSPFPQDSAQETAYWFFTSEIIVLVWNLSSIGNSDEAICEVLSNEGYQRRQSFVSSMWQPPCPLCDSSGVSISMCLRCHWMGAFFSLGISALWKQYVSLCHPAWNFNCLLSTGVRNGWGVPLSPLWPSGFHRMWPLILSALGVYSEKFYYSPETSFLFCFLTLHFW